MAREGKPQGHAGIGHTRWATHGEPSDVNSHPHSGRRVTIVHNGIIENYKQLKQFLIDNERTEFLSDTDTEVVAQLLDFYYDGNPICCIRKVLHELRGSFALKIVFADRPETVYAVRCESPLIVAQGQGEVFIASDVPAVIKYTKDYYLLEHGTISLITEGMPAIAVATQNSLLEKTVSNIKEVKARGAMTVVICDEQADIDSEAADFFIRIPKISEMLMPMVATVPMQLLAYYTSANKGNDVDKPRNLAKSVTVE